MPTSQHNLKGHEPTVAVSQACAHKDAQSDRQVHKLYILKGFGILQALTDPCCTVTTTEDLMIFNVFLSDEFHSMGRKTDPGSLTVDHENIERLLLGLFSSLSIDQRHLLYFYDRVVGSIPAHYCGYIRIRLVLWYEIISNHDIPTRYIPIYIYICIDIVHICYIYTLIYTCIHVSCWWHALFHSSFCQPTRLDGLSVASRTLRWYFHGHAPSIIAGYRGLLLVPNCSAPCYWFCWAWSWCHTLWSIHIAAIVVLWSSQSSYWSWHIMTIAVDPPLQRACFIQRWRH